jgi:HEAT repeat protein
MARLRKEAAREAARRDLSQLLATLQDTSQDARLRFRSGEAIAALGDTATGSVLPLLHHNDSYTRERAADILGEVRAASAVDPLIAVLQNDPDADVVTAAAYALGKIGEARAVDPLMQGLGADDADARIACAKGLILLGVIAIEPLLAALSSSDWRTKLGAIYAFRGFSGLPPLRDPRATDELMRIVVNRREHRYVAVTACQALAEIGGKRTIGAVAGRLRDQDPIIREQAARAIADIAKALRCRQDE